MVQSRGFLPLFLNMTKSIANPILNSYKKELKTIDLQELKNVGPKGINNIVVYTRFNIMVKN